MAVRPASEGKFEFDVPVVVVGAGSCGLAASLAVHDAGVEVLILERDENSNRQHLTLRGPHSRSLHPVPA